MWTPKQLLYPDVVAALTRAGFAPEFIEFLGWKSGTSSALNNSKNPCLAANTILSRPNGVAMLQVFLDRKVASMAHPEFAPQARVVSVLKPTG